ncbi:metallophosphoesterase [bacterium]|nr:metallophosphoesterase [bacterium]
MRRSKKKNGLFDKFSNVVLVFIFVIITSWGIQVTNAATSGLKFAQISDAHYASNTQNNLYRLTKESPDLLEDAIQQVNLTPNIDFVMFTGDQINTPYEQELIKFIRYANTLKYPWYAALGNHDICVGGYLTKSLYNQILNNKNKNFKFNKMYYSFNPKSGYKVIVLDSIIDDRITANGYIDKEQLSWLDKQLKSAKNDTVLIFLHVPVKEPFSSKNHSLINSDDVYEILKKYNNPIGVFTGHYHTTKIVQDGNILFVSTPALVSYPNSFRIINVTNQKKKVVFDIVFKETNLKDLQKKAKLMVFSSGLYYGEPKDRTFTYEIER